MLRQYSGTKEEKPVGMKKVSLGKKGGDQVADVFRSFESGVFVLLHATYLDTDCLANM